MVLSSPPDGRSKYFDVSPYYAQSIDVPWSPNPESIYTLVINGADATSEMYYAFNVSNYVAGNSIEPVYDWDAFFQAGDIPAQMSLITSYEADGGNNSENTACNVGNGFTVVRSYIQKNDIDYYTLNINENTTTVSVDVTQETDIAVTKDETDQAFAFTADEGYDSYYWELNGTALPVSDNVCTINKATLKAGVYELYLKAGKQNKYGYFDYRSKTFFFRVSGN